MNATVLIVTYNRAHLLGPVLGSLRTQLQAGDQLVVVDDGSTDDTENLVREVFPDVTYVKVPENEGYRLATRINQGLAVAEHDMIWRLDSDCVPLEEGLDTLKGLFRKDRIIAGAVQYQDKHGVVSAPDHEWRLRRLADMRSRTPADYGYWSRTGEVFDPAFCFGGNLCFSKEEALACGGFDSDFDGGWGAEDAWFAEQLMFKHNARLLYAPTAAVVHQWHPQEGEHRSTEAYRRNNELWTRKARGLRFGDITPGPGGTWKPPLCSDPSAEPPALPYALLSITGPDMVNAGNIVVELALLGQLPEPAIVASVFQPPTDESVQAIRDAGCRIAICSGTTVYGDGTPLDKWAEALDDIPIVVIGGCFWSPQRTSPASVPTSKLEFTARDLFTATHLNRGGIVAPYVGCPSLLLEPFQESRGKTNTKRIGAGFHRKGLVRQLDLFASLALKTGRPITVMAQEWDEMIAGRLFQSELEGKVDVDVALLANLRVIEEWEELFSSFDCCTMGT